MAGTCQTGLGLADRGPGCGLSISAYQGKQDTLAEHRLTLFESVHEIDLKQVELVLNITVTFGPAIHGGMMLGEIISIIVHAFVPINVELLLGLAIPEPVISHIP